MERKIAVLTVSLITIAFLSVSIASTLAMCTNELQTEPKTDRVGPYEITMLKEGPYVFKAILYGYGKTYYAESVWKPYLGRIEMVELRELTASEVEDLLNVASP